MTITTALVLIIVTIIGVGVALAGVIIPASNRQSRDISELRQQVNQLAQQVGHLAGLLEGLRGRPLAETETNGVAP